MSFSRAAWRIGLSLARRRHARFVVVRVDIGGGIWVHADLQTPLGLGLYRYGLWAVEPRLCSELLRTGDVFVDGGANIGLFALTGAAAVGPMGRVVACEPGPGTMGLLKANTQCNGFAMIDLHEVALAESPGTAAFTVFEEGSGLASFAPNAPGGHSVVVDVTTLDDLTLGFGDRVALVKLDLEGAEVRALRGASSLIKRSAPLFLIEVDPDHLERQGSSVADLMGLLQPHGYQAYAITSQGKLTKLDGGWRAPNLAFPDLLIAPPQRAPRLRGLVDFGADST